MPDQNRRPQFFIWLNGLATRDTNPMLQAMVEGMDATDAWQIIRHNGRHIGR